MSKRKTEDQDTGAAIATLEAPEVTETPPPAEPGALEDIDGDLAEQEAIANAQETFANGTPTDDRLKEITEQLNRARSAADTAYTRGMNIGFTKDDLLSQEWVKLKQLRRKEEKAKQKLAKRKAAVKEHECRIAEIMDERINPRPLYDAAARVESPNGNGHLPAGTRPTQQDDSWREITLSEALKGEGMTEKLFENLASFEPPLRTMGDLQDYLNTGQGQPITSIKGIGEATAEKIEKALDLFWESRKDQQPAAVGATPETTESDDEDEDDDA